MSNYTHGCKRENEYPEGAAMVYMATSKAGDGNHRLFRCNACGSWISAGSPAKGTETTGYGDDKYIWGQWVSGHMISWDKNFSESFRDHIGHALFDSVMAKYGPVEAEVDAIDADIFGRAKVLSDKARVSGYWMLPYEVTKPLFDERDRRIADARRKLHR